jgi:3-methyladenine DNA glycosylase AlkC
MNFLQKLHAGEDPNTSIEILEELATDKEYWIRSRVARNPNASPKILQKLATDKAYVVRHYVAQHPNRNELIERLVFMTEYQLYNA